MPKFKNRIYFEQFHQADKTQDTKKRDELLSFVCIGAGVTGVELVGELSNLFSKELSRTYPQLCMHVRIILINNRESITLGSHVWFGEKAQERLSTLPKVEVLNNTEVVEITHNGVRTNKGYIPAHTAIWTGGVTGARVSIVGQPPVVYDNREGVVVTPELYLEGKNSIFIVGDTASIPASDGRPYAMQAQFAVLEGQHAGKDLLLQGKKPMAFEAKARGFLMPIGKHYGLAEVFGLQVQGLFAWGFRPYHLCIFSCRI